MGRIWTDQHFTRVVCPQAPYIGRDRCNERQLLRATVSRYLPYGGKERADSVTALRF